MTGGVLMSKSSLLRVFILVFSGVFSIGEDLEAHKAFAGNELGK